MKVPGVESNLPGEGAGKTELAVPVLVLQLVRLLEWTSQLLLLAIQSRGRPR